MSFYVNLCSGNTQNPPNHVAAPDIWNVFQRHAGSVVSDTHVEDKMALFKKSDEDDSMDITTAPRVAQTRRVQSKNVSVIGPTLVFKGELSADEDLIIEGCIEGTIAHHKKHLTVGEQGRVTADIHASSVIVLGQLIGDIHSEGIVSLAKSANVKGDIFCARIVMEDGARFQGKIDMGESVKVAVAATKPVQSEPVRIDKIPNSGGAKSS